MNEAICPWFGVLFLGIKKEITEASASVGLLLATAVGALIRGVLISNFG